MKIFLSGVRTWYSYFARWHDRRGVLPPDLPLLEHTFPSYWYQKANRDGLLDVMPGSLTILDSGAHTMFAKTGYSAHGFKLGKDRLAVEALRKYHASYLVFLKKNWNRYDYFVELDVASLFGMDVIRAMRTDIRKSGLWSKCILGWHRENGEDDFEWMLDNTEAKWIGMEGQRPGASLLPYNRFLKPCYERGIRVHGFALIADRVLKKYPFYSVDATSWLIPVIYGKQPTFTGDRVRIKDVGRKTKGRTHDSLLKPQRKLEKSIEAYRRLEKFYTDYWKAKGVDWERQIENNVL